MRRLLDLLTKIKLCMKWKEWRIAVQPAAACTRVVCRESEAQTTKHEKRKTRGDKAASKKTKVIHFFISYEARDVDENVFQLSWVCFYANRHSPSPFWQETNHHRWAGNVSQQLSAMHFLFRLIAHDFRLNSFFCALAISPDKSSHAQNDQWQWQQIVNHGHFIIRVSRARRLFCVLKINIILLWTFFLHLKPRAVNLGLGDQLTRAQTAIIKKYFQHYSNENGNVSRSRTRHYRRRQEEFPAAKWN